MRLRLCNDLRLWLIYLVNRRIRYVDNLRLSRHSVKLVLKLIVVECLSIEFNLPVLDCLSFLHIVVDRLELFDRYLLLQLFERVIAKRHGLHDLHVSRSGLDLDNRLIQHHLRVVDLLNLLHDQLLVLESHHGALFLSGLA